MYTMPNRKAIAYPGLNAGACAHHGVKQVEQCPSGALSYEKTSKASW